MHILVELAGRIRDTSMKFIFALTKDRNLPEFRPTLQHLRSHLPGADDEDVDDDEVDEDEDDEKAFFEFSSISSN
jgi:hypothetical protein